MNPIRTICGKELLDSLRDRRTMLTAVLLPVLLMPAILVGSIKFQEYQIKQAEEKPVVIALEHEAATPTLVTFLKAQPQVEIVQTADYPADLDSGKIAAYLSYEADIEQDVQKGIPANIRVIQKSSNINSTTAAAKALALLQQFNREMAAQRLEAKNVDVAVLDALVPVPVDIASSQEKSGFFLGLLLPMFIVLFALVGGMYIAIDVSAGEKERKTLEALLLTPATRLHIVAGKFAAVAITASTTIILSLASMYAAFKLFPPSFGAETVAIQLSLGAVGIMLGIGIILAIMFSGLLLSVAIFAKSYKEAQNYITPFYLLAVLPVAIFAQIPGFQPTEAFFLIPGVNAVFVIKEVLINTYNGTHILLTVASLLVFAAIAIVAASKIYAKESVLFRS